VVERNSRVQGSGFRVQGSGFRVQGSRVQGFKGSGFSVHREKNKDFIFILDFSLPTRCRV